jgi:hypothetical protein
MKRTQLYLDDDLWNALHSRAKRQGTTISELVRQAARKEYLDKQEGRRKAMHALVGLRKDRDIPDSVEYVRSLRRGSRLTRLADE